MTLECVLLGGLICAAALVFCYFTFSFLWFIFTVLVETAISKGGLYGSGEQQKYKMVALVSGANPKKPVSVVIKDLRSQIARLTDRIDKLEYVQADTTCVANYLTYTHHQTKPSKKRKKY